MKKCIFCDYADKDQIVSETDNFYAIPTIGQIPKKGGHMLLIPKDHTSCLGALTEELLEEFVDFKSQVETAIKKGYGTIKRFEHGIIGQTVAHAHLQVVPSPVDLFQTIQSEYPAYKKLNSIQELNEIYNERRVYLFYENQQDDKYAFILDAIPQYLRLVAAKAMGCTPRGDWKVWRSDEACAKMDDELIADTVETLKQLLEC